MRTRSLALVALTALLARPAAAELVTVAYQTEVVSENLRSGSASILPIGTPVRGSFTYDASTPGVMITQRRAQFEDALVEHTVVIQGQTFTQPLAGDLFLADLSRFDVLESDNAAFAETATIGEHFLYELDFYLLDRTSTVFTELALPNSFDFENFDITVGIMWFLRREGSTIVAATSYTLGPFRMIPEPGTLTLFAAACSAISRPRRRRPSTTC